MKQSDIEFMQEALNLANQAAGLGEVPVGAVVVHHGQIVGRGMNLRESQNDPLAHAEILAIKQASEHLGRWRLTGCTLYVTLEPCAMCAGALVNARLDKVVFGARDSKAGAVVSLMRVCDDARLNHRLEITEGIFENESKRLLKDFFKARR